MTRFSAPTPSRGGAPSHSPPDTLYAPGINLAQGLGWFSIGLGLTELLAPRLISNLTGVRNLGLLQMFGLREIATGIGILSNPRPAGSMWGRVVGDGLDLAALVGVLLDGDRDRRGRALGAAVAVAGVTALDVVAATGLSTAAALEGSGNDAERARLASQA